MNNRFFTIACMIASSALFIAGCSESNSAFETPNTSDTPLNDGLIAQNNFTLTLTPSSPKYVDLTTGDFTAVTSEVSVQIGDNNNQLITGSRTIQFRTEWGLIDPSCVTEEGTCSVTWRSGSPDDMPSNAQNTILAYSTIGQESFKDFDDNGLFNDGDEFTDVEEPFINLNENLDGSGIPIFDTGELVIDTINGVDITGANNQHDAADGLYNGPNCSHSSLCSTTTVTSTVWASAALVLTGGDTFTVGGTVTGLTGTVVLQNNLSDDLSISADGSFTFSVSIAKDLDYDVTVKTDPVGQACIVTNGTGTITADITNVTVTCS
ncbi:MAG TPA: hypothetical protein ENJ28_09330 [Gammaproteobacteria bacterium]|nr:hypothetical protein [Gammaproteobacteria bacterium]